MPVNFYAFEWAITEQTEIKASRYIECRSNAVEAIPFADIHRDLSGELAAGSGYRISRPYERGIFDRNHRFQRRVCHDELRIRQKNIGDVKNGFGSFRPELVKHSTPTGGDYDCSSVKNDRSVTFAQFGAWTTLRRKAR